MQVQGGSDQGEMRERLRKISDLPPRVRVVLFRQQAHIVAPIAFDAVSIFV
jgi:hypothetical protein